jgi:hypothetical protein
LTIGCALIYTFASLRKLAIEKELKRESLILADRAVIDTKVSFPCHQVDSLYIAPTSLV